MCRCFSLFFTFVMMIGIYSHAFSQTYTVEVSVTDMWWNSFESFRIDLRADIYRDGELIPSSNDYYYKWYFYLSHIGYWQLGTSSDFGRYEMFIDQVANGYIMSYVVVTDSVNHTFGNIQSDVVGPLQMNGEAKFVSFTPYSETGANLDELVDLEHYRYTINQWREYNGLLTKYINERLKAAPNYLSSLEKKIPVLEF